MAKVKSASRTQRRPKPTSKPYNQSAEPSVQDSGIVTLKQSDYQALPILRNRDKERILVKHIMDRCYMANEERMRRVARMQAIDVQISGYITLTKDDKKRRRDNEIGKPPKPTDHNLPITHAQIDEAVTYMMGVFAPEMEIFEAVAPADVQALAQGVVAEINKQGQSIRGQYFRHIAKAVQNALRYNLAAMTCYWENYEGNLFTGAPGGVVTMKPGQVWSGNILTSADMYNFLYDTTVHPVDLPLHGEYFAEVERITPFRVRKRAQDKLLFGIDRYIHQTFFSTINLMGATPDARSMYINPPSVRDDHTNMQSPTNWITILRATDVKESAPGIEFVKFTGWINPSDFGLSNDDELQVWRIIVANSQYLTYAVQLNITHGMLPVACAAPLEDDLKNEQRTIAEHLLPLQTFASFLMNAHQRATRKGIYGINVYNQHLIPGLDKDADELIGANVPFRSASSDVDIDKAFRHYNTSPNTDQFIPQIGGIIELMQKILPTNMLQQVADLERATLYQAAATVQAGNRRQLKNARLFSTQLLEIIKYQILYNIYQNMSSITYVDDVTGQRTSKSMSDIVNADLETFISTGLKGLDKLMIIQVLRDVINSLLQSQQGIQEIDIVKLLNYFTSMMGDRTDLNQFRRQPTQQVDAQGNPIPGAAAPADQGQPGAPAKPGISVPAKP